VAAVRVGVDEAAAMYTRCNRFGGEGGGKKYPLAVALTPNFPVPPLTSRLWGEKTRRRSRLKNRARICAAADSLGHDKWVRRKVFAPIYTPTQTVIIISCVCVCVCVCVVASRQFAVEKKKKLSVGIACDYCVYGSMNHTDLYSVYYYLRLTFRAVGDNVVPSTHAVLVMHNNMQNAYTHIIIVIVIIIDIRRQWNLMRFFGKNVCRRYDQKKNKINK